MLDFAKLIEWSPFLGRLINRFPEIEAEEFWQTQLSDEQLYSQVYDAVSDAEDDKTLAEKLRIQRNLKMARIAVRDLGGLADLHETMGQVSTLADALVNAAVDWHYAKFCERYGVPMGKESGEPQKLHVIGMGKLGGQELNFSSDIDLIYAFPEHGETQGAARPTSNEQFFIRLGQAVNKALAETTMDGFVYRVDMRLRPFGDQGPLVVSFAALETYYEIHGRAWERYALVKARLMAGDKNEGKYLFDILRPFVYRRYVDFSAMDSLRELKRMIAEQVRKKGMTDNVKLGRGGIREVEFIVQAFQLVHGGRDRQLQGRQLLPTLQLLLEKDFITPQVKDGLENAYFFLRKVENRLQMWGDQQTHDLPKEESRWELLAASTGFESVAEFRAELDKHREFVQSQFVEVFAEEEGEPQDEMMALWQSDSAAEISEESEATVEIQGYSGENAQAFIEELNKFKQSRLMKNLGKESLERLDATMPLILKQTLEVENIETFKRVLEVVSSIAKRSVYLVLLKENPSSIKHLVELCSVSPWATDMLVKHPALLDQLLDERTLYEPLLADELMAEAMQIVETAGEDEEMFMQEIRIWRHAQVFKVAAADVTGNVHIMKVSDYLTWIAESVLNACVEYAWRLMQKKSGVPGGLTENRNPFVVLGYGKIGGIELGYGSDLDIVMCYQGLEASAQAVAPNGRSIDNAVYFIRMGQKVISLMTTLMPAGTLYEVDTRLRPNGASGMMVVSLDEYQKYITEKAWTWEHQALVRVRAIVGDVQSKLQFTEFKQEFVGQARDIDALRTEVVEMRNKMRASLDKSNAEQFDLKQGAGGIVDIEFMMQFFVLAYAHQYSDLMAFSDNMRILDAVAKAELLTQEQVAQLQQAYQTYRSKYHRVALQNEKPIVESTCYTEQRAAVQSIWQAVMES